VVEEGLFDVRIGLQSTSKDAGRGSPLKQVCSNGRGPFVKNECLRDALHHLRGFPPQIVEAVMWKMYVSISTGKP